MELVAFRISKKPYKKYDAVFSDGSIVSFGDTRYQHYRDTTPLMKWSHLDHLDKHRQRMYFARHKKNYKKFSADWLSKNFLWS